MAENKTFARELSDLIRQTTKRIEASNRARKIQTNEVWLEVHAHPNTYYRNWEKQGGFESKALLAIGENRLIDWKWIN